MSYRNVSFVYPDASKYALRSISFGIRPGQVVVIVGVNGSGKSSVIKLLNRLYDPTEGEILLDGLPLQSYRLADVRRCTSVLRQDHSPYPLSLRENVALGLPRYAATDEEIYAAIRQGCAQQFVEKLDHGLSTTLAPVKTAMMWTVGEEDTGLKAIIDDKEKRTELSGGETQRLSA